MANALDHVVTLGMVKPRRLTAAALIHTHVNDQCIGRHAADLLSTDHLGCRPAGGGDRSDQEVGMGHSAVDRPCTGHIRDDPLDSSGHACQGACILVEYPDDGAEALGFSSSSLASSARTDDDHVERRNTRCATQESPSTASLGHQVLAGQQHSHATADGGDGLEDGTASVTFFYKLPRDRMQLAISNEGTNRSTTWASQMEKARDCTAIPDQLMLILAGTVQLHEHISAVTDLGGVQAHARTHSAVVAVFEACILARARLDQDGVSSGGQTLRTLWCKRDPALVGQGLSNQAKAHRLRHCVVSSPQCTDLCGSSRCSWYHRAMPDPDVTWYCANCLTTFQTKAEVCPNLSCGLPQPESGWGQMYQSGDIIDRTYRVSRRLALGGAGITYLVRALGDDDQEVGPWIALKLLFANRDSGAYLRRLATEAQILQTLHHPNIVEYLGFVHRTGQSPYLLTQFEEGGSLIDHMKRVGTMGVRETAAVGHQICQALQKGHAQGIIHRDLKPENLLLRSETAKGAVPQIRVADFGIAKVEGGIGAAMTRMGAFVGTPQYAAPEQFLGAPASDKADVYSLGAVMVFLMTGRPLVAKAHTMAAEDVYAKLETLMPPGIQRQSDTPEDCDTMNHILGACMAMDPLRRCSVADAGRMLAVLADPNFSGTVDDEVFRASATIAPPSVLSPTVLPPTVLPPTIVPSSDSDPVLEVEMTWKTPPARPSGDAKTTAVVEASQPPRRRWPVVLLASVLLAAGAALWTFALAPEQLDGLPGRGGWPKVSDGGIVRQLAQRAARSVRSDIRTACPEAKGAQMEVEAVLDRDGTVRWARPVNRLSAQAWCVAIEMEGASAGSRLKSPYRVRLQVRP